MFGEWVYRDDRNTITKIKRVIITNPYFSTMSNNILKYLELYCLIENIRIDTSISARITQTLGPKGLTDYNTD